MLFAGWSSGVLTRLLALTCCQKGLQDFVCVCLRAYQWPVNEITNVLPGRTFITEDKPAWIRECLRGHKHTHARNLFHTQTPEEASPRMCERVNSSLHLDFNTEAIVLALTGELWSL
ncbi:hypothetical protein fugu_018862 [Takifugu bimaculatus]|uniref:Uncharacterized protein n=1 Tax=Takifugu bimaculatus TaxID=433685 RepID=A0A4Z2BKV4_9TELE|nr:hypothetical protein fugu_018862 [Takifugu bimaculatus]